MVPHISKKGKVNFLCQIGLFLGQSLPTFNYIHSLFFVFCFLFWSIVCFTLLSTSLCHSGVCCSLRVQTAVSEPQPAKAIN